MRGADAQLVKGGSRSGPGGAYAWIVFFAFVALYVVTLLPGVLPADSGEFQWVAARADVAHPPGYPLYSMAGWLFAQVPLGPTAAWRVNLFSAVTAAATVALVFSMARELTGSILGGLAAALTLGSATTFWATATKASIRPLTAFFTALCIYALVRHTSERRVSGVGTEARPERPVESGRETRPTASDTEAQSEGDRYLVLFSLAFGLGVTHHPSLVFPGVVFLLYLVLVDPALLRQPRRWLKPLGALLPGLLVLIYLPLRGAPELATLSGFLDHVLARGFGGDMFALSLLDRVVLLPTLLRFQFNRALLAGALLGASLLLWRRRKLAILLIGSFLVHTAVTLTYDAPQTVEYEMPAYVPLALLMGIAVGQIGQLRTRASDGSTTTSERESLLTPPASRGSWVDGRSRPGTRGPRPSAERCFPRPTGRDLGIPGDRVSGGGVLLSCTTLNIGLLRGGLLAGLLTSHSRGGGQSARVKGGGSAGNRETMGRSGSDESRQPEGALAAQVPGTHGTCKAPVLSVIGHVVAIVLVIASIANLLAHLPSYRRLSQSHDTRRYVQTVLRDAPEGAVILSNWHWFTPLRYAQQIEGVRPDVMVEYVPPRGEPLAQTWVRRIEEHISARPVVVARVFEHEYGALPYAFEPLGEAFLVRSEPRTGVPSDMIALDEVLGGVAGRETGQSGPSHSEKQIELLGYRLGSEEIRPAQPLTMELAWSPRDAPSTELALFAQLIGPDGELWSTAEDLRHPAATLSTGEVVVDRFVVYPRLHAPPGAYSLVVGGYPIGASNGGRFRTAEGEDDVLLQTVPLQPSRTRPVTNHPLFVRFAGGPTLIGVDYETGSDGGTRTYLHWAGPSGPADLELRGKGDAPVKTSRVPALRRGEYASVGIDGAGGWSGDQPQGWPRLVVLGQTANRRWNLFFNGPIHLPAPRPGERYVPFGNAAVLTHVGGPRAGLEPGTEATLSLRFDAQRPLQRDYIVSTSLTGLNADGTWAWRVSHDTVPALGAIPTLKWIHDSSVLDPHRMDVPQETPAVPVRGSLQVYDHFTQRSLPSLDGRHGLGVELGSWRVPQ